MVTEEHTACIYYGSGYEILSNILYTYHNESWNLPNCIRSDGTINSSVDIFFEKPNVKSISLNV